ncbi:MAG: GNAT family N-acetyltransferase [Pirellulales bacterium]|nr:GNAT family N-acetyltransferase [Pirellulales bacterium]
MGDQLLVAVVSILPERTHWIRGVEILCNDLTMWGGDEFEVEHAEFRSLAALSEALTKHFAAESRQFAIVISDLLLDEGEFKEDAKESIDPHLHCPLVTIAISPDRRPVADIDFVVSNSANRDELAEALSLLADRLRYLVAPIKGDYQNPFDIRPIDDEYELAKYYRLRHKVYRTMGYLNVKKASVSSKLEIDGCDANAIHLGAFEKCGGFQRLVGTARILLAQSDETHWADWTRSLLKSDRTLRVIVRNESIPLGLPVFQSQALNDELQESLERELLCAELSRVIVEHPYRGAGLSRRLVKTAIKEAEKARVDRLYLECLRLHEPVYRKYGFRTIPGKYGQVIGVSKSMIAMRLDLPSSKEAISDQSVSSSPR